MSRKKEFIYPSGREGMLINCDEYEVELAKTVDKDYYGDTIKFKDIKNNIIYPLFGAFNIDWDKEEDGGRLELKYKDRWGSRMHFIHYAPSDLKGMFDFILKEYDIYNSIYPITDSK